jgi:hypothetical protein
MKGMIHSQMMVRQQHPILEILLDEEKAGECAAKRFEQRSL